MSFIKKSVRKLLARDQNSDKKLSNILNQQKADILKNVLSMFFEKQKTQNKQQNNEVIIQNKSSFGNLNQNYQDERDQLDSLIYTQKQDDDQTIDFQLQDRMLDCLQDQKHLSLYRESKRLTSQSKKSDYRRNEQTQIEKIIDAFKQEQMRYSEKITGKYTKYQQSKVIFQQTEEINIENIQYQQPILVGSSNSFEEKLQQQNNMKQNKRKHRFQKYKIDSFQQKTQIQQNGSINDYFDQVFKLDKKQSTSTQQKSLFNNFKGQSINKLQNIKTDTSFTKNFPQSNDYNNNINRMKSSLQINLIQKNKQQHDNSKDQTKQSINIDQKNNNNTYSINILSPVKDYKQKQGDENIVISFIEKKQSQSQNIQRKENKIVQQVKNDEILTGNNNNKQEMWFKQKEIPFLRKQTQKKPLPVIYGSNSHILQNNNKNFNQPLTQSDNNKPISPIINNNKPISPIISINNSNNIINNNINNINNNNNNNNGKFKINFNYNSEKDLNNKDTTTTNNNNNSNNNNNRITKQTSNQFSILPLQQYSCQQLPSSYIGQVQQKKYITFTSNYFTLPQTQQRMPIFLQRLRRLNSYCPNLYLKSINSVDIFNELKLILSTIKSALVVLDILFQKLTLRSNQIRIFMETIKCQINLPVTQEFVYTKKILEEEIMDYFLKTGWEKFYIDQIRFIRPQERYQRRKFISQTFQIAMKNFNQNVNHYLNNCYCDLTKQQGKQRYLRIRNKFWEIQKNIKMMSEDIYTFWLASCNFPYIYEDYMRFLNGQPPTQAKKDQMLAQIIKGQKNNDVFSCSIIGKKLKEKLISTK